MYIYITESISDLLLSDPSNHELVCSLTSLAEAARKGKHIITANYSTLETIINFACISATHKDIFKQISKKVTFWGKAQQNFSVWLKIVNGNNNLSIIEMNESIIYTVSYDLISRTDILDRSIILAEDITDISFLEIIANYYIKTNFNNAITLSLDRRHGGGSVISEVYKSIQDSNDRFCLCLVDSDYRYPNDKKLGDTARKISKINDPNKILSKIYIISVKEIENLIPLNIYQELPKSNSGLKNLPYYKYIHDNIDKLAINYVDIKEGLLLFEITNSPNDFKDYWGNIANELCKYDSQINLVCTKNPSCTRKNNCSCYIYQGLGPNILKSILDQIEVSTLLIEKDIPNHLTGFWSEIGKSIVSYCCSIGIMPQSPNN